MAAPLTPNQRYFLYFIRVLRGISFLSLLFNIAGYAIVIAVYVKYWDLLPTDVKVFGLITSAGFIFLAGLVCVAEFEFRWFIRRFLAFKFWAVRGFCVCWLGVQTVYNVGSIGTAIAYVNPSTTSNDSNTTLEKVMTNFSKVVGYIMISIGLVFVLLSLLCLRKCLPDDDDDLDRKLTEEDPSSINGGASGSEEQARQLATLQQLLSNWALASGISVEEAKAKYSGPPGTGSAPPANSFRGRAASQVAPANASPNKI